MFVCLFVCLLCYIVIVQVTEGRDSVQRLARRFQRRSCATAQALYTHPKGLMMPYSPSKWFWIPWSNAIIMLT